LSFDEKQTIRQSAQINADMSGFKRLFNALLNEGVYLGPSGYEVGFVSQAHTPEILNSAAKKFCLALDLAFA